jgi:hypothetical protein
MRCGSESTVQERAHFFHGRLTDARLGMDRGSFLSFAALCCVAAATPARAASMGDELLVWAQRLVAELAPEDNVYGSRPTYVEWSDAASGRRGRNRSVCSSFASHLLEQSFGYTVHDIDVWFGKRGPQAREYHDRRRARLRPHRPDCGDSAGRYHRRRVPGRKSPDRPRDGRRLAGRRARAERAVPAADAAVRDSARRTSADPRSAGSTPSECRKPAGFRAKPLPYGTASRTQTTPRSTTPNSALRCRAESPRPSA